MATFSRYSYLLEDLECPICTEYLHTPIRQCVSGHSLCNKCYFKVNNCPVCRLNLSHTARSVAVENITNKILIPCKNRDYGCPDVRLGGTIQQHELHCKYRMQKCPMKYLNCGWMGRANQFKRHCFVKHAKNTFLTNKQQLRFTDFHMVNSRIFMFIMNAYNKLFKCVWGVTCETGSMHWGVFIIGKADFNYCFEVVVTNSTTRREQLTLTGQCTLQIHDGEDIFDDTQVLVSHWNVIKEFCRNGVLLYSIAIHKKC